MSTRAEDAFARTHAASLRAYERGRLRMAAVHAGTFCLLCAAASFVLVGGRSLIWLPLTLVLWAVLEWRGVALLRGGRIGALAGILTLALPLSILRRCCRPGAVEVMGADCCTMPGACAAAGVVVGLVMACLLPARSKRRDTLLGMVLGIAAVAPLKCSGLLAGEAVGLVGGLLAGVAATSAVRIVIGRWTARA